jgi:hypothetical protein
MAPEEFPNKTPTPNEAQRSKYPIKESQSFLNFVFLPPFSLKK